MKCLTVSQLCDRWQVSKDCIYSLIHSGKLAAINVGSARNKASWRITLLELQRFESQNTNVKPKVLSGKRSRKLPAVPKVIRD